MYELLKVEKSAEKTRKKHRREEVIYLDTVTYKRSID